MKNQMICFVVTFFCLVALSCTEEKNEPDRFYSINPVDSIASFFAQAEHLVGEGVALYSISGVQHDVKPDTSYNLKWTCSFIKGNRVIAFSIINGKTIRTDNTIEELPMGCEYIYRDDERLASIFSPAAMFDTCIRHYNKPVLKMELSVPLLSQKSNFTYKLFSKEGYNELGTDLFIYDANTGDDLTGN